MHGRHQSDNTSGNHFFLQDGNEYGRDMLLTPLRTHKQNSLFWMGQIIHYPHCLNYRYRDHL